MSFDFALAVALALALALAFDFALAVALAFLSVIPEGNLLFACTTTNAVILSGARSAKSKNPDTFRLTTTAQPFSTTNKLATRN